MEMRSSASILAASLILSSGIAVSAQGEPNKPGQETVIEIVAQRFRYTPNEIVLQKGKPARLEFRALDFTHGFTIPDLGIRADLPPGRVTIVRLTPDKVGAYDFLCDNFCGAGHEQMNGKIIVKE